MCINALRAVFRCCPCSDNQDAPVYPAIASPVLIPVQPNPLSPHRVSDQGPTTHPGLKKNYFPPIVGSSIGIGLLEEAKEKYIDESIRLGISNPAYLKRLREAYDDLGFDLSQLRDIYILIDREINNCRSIGIENTSKKKYLDILRRELEEYYSPKSKTLAEFKSYRDKIEGLKKEAFEDCFLEDCVKKNLNTSQMGTFIKKIKTAKYFKDYQYLYFIKDRLIYVMSIANDYAKGSKKPLDEDILSEIDNWAYGLPSHTFESSKVIRTKLLDYFFKGKDELILSTDSSPAASPAPPRGSLSDKLSPELTISSPSPILDLLEEKEEL